MQAGLAARMIVGPLAVLAFFLSWGTGSGPLAAVDFSGYRLVAFTGSLDVLVDGAAPTALLATLRFAILAVLVAAVWHSLLAPTLRWHPLYAITGWYIVTAALVLLVLTLARGDIMHPAAGVLFMASAATLFAVADLAPRLRSISLSHTSHAAVQRSAG